MGVGGCETKTIGYTCRSVVLKVFGPGFNSRRLHQTALRACRWPLYLPIVIEASDKHLKGLSLSVRAPARTFPTSFVLLLFGTLRGRAGVLRGAVHRE